MSEHGVPVGVQEVAADLLANFRCSVVFLGEDLKQKYYRGELKCLAGMLPYQTASLACPNEQQHPGIC